MGAPAHLDAQANIVLSALNTLIRQARNHVLEGFAITDGGTTQAAGAGTAPNIDLDTAAGFVVIAGRGYDVAAGTDIDATAGDTVAWGAETNRSVVCAVVRETGAADDTPAWQIVPGTVAVTGSEAPPTDAAIDAALGHRNWARVGNVTFNRTGAATITVTPITESARVFDGVRALPSADLSSSDA